MITEIIPGTKAALESLTILKRPSRQFRVFIYSANGVMILEELSIAAPNMARARESIAKTFPDIPAHRVYCLDVTK